MTRVFERIMDKYLHLDLYPDASAALAAMQGRKLAILSNGSTDMLNTLVRNSGLDRVLDATISINSKKIFKPSPDAYTLIEAKLGVSPAEVLFVSSNPWDACGAKAFGLNVAWIERVTPEAMALACVEKRPRRAADDVQGDPDADGRTRARARLSHSRAVGIAEGRRPMSLNRMSLESVRAFFAEKAPTSPYRIAAEFGDGGARRRSLWRRAGADRQDAVACGSASAWC